MSAKLNLRQTLISFLKAYPEQRFTAREIASWIFDNHREACEEKRRRSKQNLVTDAIFIQQLIAEIGSNRIEIQKKEPGIRTTEGRPRSYFFSPIADSSQILSSIPVDFSAFNLGRTETPTKNITEADLYPLLSHYLHSVFRLFPKRIDEKRSTKRQGPNGNKWLFPDLIAMEDLGRDWDKTIQECVRETGDARARLWSFEVKLILNSSNVREAWFQTVSNSSWANFGYLVAANVEDSSMKELRLLSAAHGIGVILLNIDDPSESEILFPAREREKIDWDACNRLAQVSIDFKDVISWLKEFYLTGRPERGNWDIPEESDD